MRAVFAQDQRLHVPPGFIVAGRMAESPERVERIDMLMEGLRAIGARLEAPPPAPRAAVGRVHPERYLTFLETVVDRWARQEGASAHPLPNVHALGTPGLAPPAYPASVIGQVGFHLGDGSAPIVSGTVAAAWASAATALHGAGLVAAGERLVYALCRPPGHHAGPETAAGFCYLANAAIAAEALVAAGRRIAILDIDVHHGNGTEAIFWRRPDVLTVSIHADPARFYPFFWGHADQTGADAGAGCNLNLPLPRGTGDAPYLETLDAALTRIAAHKADTLVLAAGLDASEADPFRGLSVTTAGFEAIGRRIRSASLPVLVVQEGGYPSPVLGTNLAALLSGLGA